MVTQSLDCKKLQPQANFYGLWFHRSVGCGNRMEIARQGENMIEELVDAISVPAILVADDGRIAAANAMARQLFGQRIDQRHYVTALRQPPLLDALDKVVRDGQVAVAPYLASDARGDVTFEATVAPLAETGAILICFEDRTAMHQAGQMRRDFVANVSHELRTPLTALLGFIETLRGAAKDDAAARERFLGIMEREAGRMNRLVDDLLSLSRVEAQERVRPSETVELAAIARRVVGALTPLAEDKSISVQTEGLSRTDKVRGDADQLSQVVTNLLENAIKYSRPDTTVTVELTREGSHPMLRGAGLVLTISDQGEGIDSFHIPRLTERFYRIDSHRSRELGGTGLGLAIVKHIVNRHRGRLKIESKLGVGSHFSVVLPTD